jgi:hypothetical protein
MTLLARPAFSDTVQLTPATTEQKEGMNMSKNNSNKFVTVVVLNDGQTFTDISGCSICIVPLEQYEEAIRAGGDARDFEPVVEIGLDNMTLPIPHEDHIAFEDENEDN